MNNNTLRKHLQNLFSKLETVSGYVEKLFLGVSIAGFLLMIVFIIAGVILRYVLKGSWTWGEEACRYIMVYSIFLGVYVASRESAHICVEVATSFTKGVVNRIFVFLSKLASAVGFYWFAVLAWNYTVKLAANGQTSPALHLPMSAIVFVLFIGFLFSGFEYTLQLGRMITEKSASTGEEGETK